MNGRLLLASMLFDSSSSADPSSNAEHPPSDSSSLYIPPQAQLTAWQEIPQSTSRGETWSEQQYNGC